MVIHQALLRSMPPNGVELSRLASPKLLSHEDLDRGLARSAPASCWACGRGEDVSNGADSGLPGRGPPGKEGDDRRDRGGDRKAYRREFRGRARVPWPRLEHLWRALQELGEGNEQTCDGKPKIAGGGTGGGSGDEANEGSHVGQSEE